MASFGVTLGPGADGPDVPALGISFQPVRQALDDLCQLVGWTWRIDPGKVLILEAGGTTGAPRAITLPDGKVFACQVEQSQRTYRTEQWVHFGVPGIRPYTFTETSDGIRRIYPLIGLSQVGEIRPVAPVGLVSVGGVYRPVSTVGDLAHDWWYREEPGAVQLEINPASAVPAAGVVITATFEANFPGAVFRSSGETPVVYGPLETITTTDDPAAAAAYADALLQQYGELVRVITLETRFLDFRPGQELSVVLVPWGLVVVSCLIDTVQIRHVLHQQSGEHHWVSRLTLIEGDTSKGSWLDFWRRGVAGGGGSISVAGGGTGGGGPTLIRPPIVELGGSRTTTLQSAEWWPIVDFYDALVDPADGVTRIVRCHSWVLDSAYTVNVRVVALTAPEFTVVGTGIAKTATDPLVIGLASDPACAFQEFAITLVTPFNYYRMEMQCSDPEGEAWVAGAAIYPV
jgi:hypothetical protein